jgi:predicted DNA-binding transcriptional regulator YafY
MTPTFTQEEIKGLVKVLRAVAHWPDDFIDRQSAAKVDSLADKMQLASQSPGNYEIVVEKLAD